MQHERYIKRCLELALNGELGVAPNPMVGCVIVHNDVIVAEGYHQQYGGPHAEVNAFNHLPKHVNVQECDVYVSLEPCSHYGKTPPCANLIVEQAPKRVIIGMLDPNHKVAGNGLKRIREAGIETIVGVLEDECAAINSKFIKAHTQKLPYITLKWAETQNGYMARTPDDNGSAKISDTLNDDFVHHLRATHQAIMVGAGTVNRDNPLLDVRYTKGRNPIKVVVSPQLSVDLTAKLFKKGKTIVYNTRKNEDTEHIAFIQLDKFDMSHILKDLYQRHIHSVLVEGGPTLLQALMDAKCWDEAIILKSSNNWESGIKAPWIGIPSNREEQRKNDLIKYFKPQ